MITTLRHPRDSIRDIAMALGLCLFATATGIGATENHPQLRIETSAGAFVVELDAVRAPLTVANFLRHVEEGHYSGTIFHRVVDGFVIQGGGYTADLALKPVRGGSASRGTAGTGCHSHGRARPRPTTAPNPSAPPALLGRPTPMSMR